MAVSDDVQVDGRDEGESTNSGPGAESGAARGLRDDVRAAVASARRSHKVILGLIDLIVHSCERDEVCARLGVDRDALDDLAAPPPKRFAS